MPVINLADVRVGDIFLTRAGRSIPWATAGLYSHASIAVSRLLRFESDMRTGVTFRPAKVKAYRVGGQLQVCEDVASKADIAIARLNWPGEFTSPNRYGPPCDYEGLQYSLLSAALNVYEGIRYPPLGTLLDVGDLAPWPRQTLIRFPVLLRAVRAGLGCFERWKSRKAQKHTGFDVGQICSTTVLEILQLLSVDSGAHWQSTNISPNSIPTLAGMSTHELRSPQLGKEDPMATVAVTQMIAHVISDLNLGSNMKDLDLTLMLRELEYGNPAVFNAAKQFTQDCFARNQSVQPDHQAATFNLLWQLEATLLGPHP